MKKNILQAKKALLALFAMLMPLLASAQTEVEIDSIWYNLDEETLQAEVTYGDAKYSGSITIPATVNHEGVQYSVTSIGDEAFYGCESLTAITIPESVTSIRNYAFKYCESLTAINIPESVTSIGEYTFQYCSNLTAITIPENSQLTSIGNSAFKDCSSLTTINIPESVTSIGEGAFFSCRSLTEIHIGSIESWLTISYGNNESRPNYAASKVKLYIDDEELPEVEIPSTVTSIPSNAFRNCSNLTAITIPEGVTSIEKHAFYGCSSLTAIVVAEGNKFYDSRNGCNALIETSSNTLIQGCSATIIPASVKSIGESAFSRCTSLTTITIPESVTSIEKHAFYGCSSLTAITCKAITPPTVGSYAFSGVNKPIPVYVPESSVEKYQADSYWKYFTNIIGVKILEKCSTPTINYTDGKLLFACDTEGAEIKTRVVTENESEHTGVELEFIPTHTFTAYATKEQYEDSDVATLTICWIPCAEEHKSEEDGILTIPSKPVLISARDGVLTLSGLAEGTEVTLYTTDGTLVANQQSKAGEAKFTVDVHQVYIVHIGDKVVKIGM